MASSEVVGFAKTGGLADVAGSLPRALARRGHQVAVVMPLYAAVRRSGRPIEKTGLTLPVPMGDRPRAALREEVAERNLPIIELPSGAGHDAAVLAAAGVPTAMLFVRSLNGGVSHSPEEKSSPEDVELAVEVLAGALARLT